MLLSFGVMILSYNKGEGAYFTLKCYHLRSVQTILHRSDKIKLNGTIESYQFSRKVPIIFKAQISSNTVI
jgi:hypothetical protein